MSTGSLDKAPHIEYAKNAAKKMLASLCDHLQSKVQINDSVTHDLTPSEDYTPKLDGSVADRANANLRIIF